jgi:hypothetical protein
LTTYIVEGEPAGAAEARVSVGPLPGGVRIDDRIERRTFTFRNGRSVAPEWLSDHPFDYPQDVAVAFTAGNLELLPVGACFIHYPTTSGRSNTTAGRRVRVETVDPDTYLAAVVPYPTKSSGMGVQFHRSLGDDPGVYLVPKAARNGGRCWVHGGPNVHHRLRAASVPWERDR